MLWRLIGAHSSVVGAPFTEVEAALRPLAFGKELGELTKVSPGPASLDSALCSRIPSLRTGTPDRADVALELLLEGRMIDAQEALSKGMINRVVPSAQFEDEVSQTVARICAGAPLSARWHKAFIERLRPRYEPLSEAELAEGYDCYDTEDFAVGYRAFLAHVMSGQWVVFSLPIWAPT